MGAHKLLVAAMAASLGIGFAGPSAASAGDTSLCKEASAVLACPTGRQATAVFYKAENGGVLTPDINVECSEITFFGSTLEPLGAPLIFLGELKYAGCNNLCLVTEVGAVSGLGLLKIGGELADVGLVGEVNVNCGPLINCTYNSAGIVGEARGPELTGGNGSVIFEQTPLEKVSKLGMLCPAKAELDAEFVSATKLWIRS